MFRIGVLRTAGAVLAAAATCGCAFAPAQASDGATPSDDHDALLFVVAPRSLAAAVEPFIAHKNSTGMSARLAVIETLDRGSGRDDAERVKRAIFAACDKHGARYVLLVGDASHFPVRFRKVAQVPPDS